MTRDMLSRGRSRPSRAIRRRIRKLRRQRRRMERHWDELYRRYGAPPRPTTDAHYNKLNEIDDEIKALLRGST